MTAAPEVTVIIPTRDRWPLLSATLASALAQEEVALEVIVVDDGSVDETPARLAEVGDERLRVHRHEAGRGVAAARNAAIAAARGEWLAFLDDDDLWAPHKLRTQLAAAAARDAAWAYSAALVVDERWSVVDRFDAPDPDGLLDVLLAYNPMPAGASNVIARAAVVRELGGQDESFSHFAGWDLWIKLALVGTAAVCPEPLLAYVQHPRSMLLSDRESVVTEWERLVEKHRVLAAQRGVEFDRGGLVRWLAWADSRGGRRLRAAAGYLRAGVMYGFERNFWMSKHSLRDGVGALFGQVLTDTGRRPLTATAAEPPAWLRAEPPPRPSAHPDRRDLLQRHRSSAA